MNYRFSHIKQLKQHSVATLYLFINLRLNALWSPRTCERYYRVHAKVVATKKEMIEKTDRKYKLRQ